MLSYSEFKNMVLGKGFDIDGYYGAQCWDGYAKYASKLGQTICNCPVSGYVKDIWNLRKTNGILKYNKEVTIMNPGDIAVFKEVDEWTPYSHIAIFDSDIDGQFGWFLGQNQGGNAYPGGGACFNLVKLPYYATFDTAFRPNGMAGGTSNADTTISKKPDQILNVGSVVSSVPMNIAIPSGCRTAIKYINGDECVYTPALGGYFPTRLLSEYDASDGAKDNYFATIKARVYLDKCTVEAVDAPSDMVMVHGIWVHAKPLIEVSES